MYFGVLKFPKNVFISTIGIIDIIIKGILMPFSKFYSFISFIISSAISRSSLGFDIINVVSLSKANVV